MLRNLIMSIVRRRAEGRVFVQHPLAASGASRIAGVSSVCRRPRFTGGKKREFRTAPRPTFPPFGGDEMFRIAGSVIGLSDDLVDTGLQESAYPAPFIDV